MVGHLDDVAAARLRADGQRFTTNRRELLAVLDGARRPMSIPDIVALRPDLAQSSVYRNLAILERAGVVHKIVTSDEFARFELAHDLTEHHHHLICSRCGAVDDFTASDELEHTLDAALAKVARRRHFTFQHHRLDIVGLCERCSA